MNPDSTSDDAVGGEPRRAFVRSAHEDAAEPSGEETVSRRAFIRTVAGTAAAGGAAAASTDEVEAQAQTYRFGGEVQGWRGRAPSAIEGQTNPTIELQAGTEYEFWFENLDGAPHNMTIQDSGGSAIVQSQLVSNQGGTGSVTFTATSSMAQYVCTVHPTTMVGDLNVTGQAETGGGGIPLVPAAYAAAIILAFLSPLLFALFLFSRRRETETTAG